MQTWYPLLGPGHDGPLPDGGGLVHMRVRTRIPFPQDTEHPPQGDHLDHPPATEIRVSFYAYRRQDLKKSKYFTRNSRQNADLDASPLLL